MCTDPCSYAGIVCKYCTYCIASTITTVYLKPSCSDATMKGLLENMFCTDTPSDVVVVSGVSVLLTAIERR